MSVPIEEIFGVELLTPAAEAEVVEIIRWLPIPLEQQRYLYVRWARSVGIPPRAEVLNIFRDRSNGSGAAQASRLRRGHPA